MGDVAERGRAARGPQRNRQACGGGGHSASHEGPDTSHRECLVSGVSQRKGRPGVQRRSPTSGTLQDGS